MVKVTQSAQVHQILNTILGKKPCSILVGEEEFPAGFISYNLLSTGPEIRIRTQQLDSPSERRVLVRHNHKHIVAICRFVARNGPTEILYPQVLEITDEAKKDAAEANDLTQFLMTNLTSAKDIAFVIENNKKKINSQVINFFDGELRQMVPYYKIFFASGDATDARLKALVKNPRIIYYSPEPPSNFNPRQYFPQDTYLEELQKSDLKVPVNLKAEFTIPILYKTHLPIGYIQVNMPRFVDDAVMQTVKKIGIALEAQLRKIGLAFEETRALPLTHVNMKQATLEIADRMLLRHFQPGFVVLFRIQKGQDSLGLFLATVNASSNLGGGRTRVTLEFQDLEAMSELNLEESLKLTQG